MLIMLLPFLKYDLKTWHKGVWEEGIQIACLCVAFSRKLLFKVNSLKFTVTYLTNTSSKETVTSGAQIICVGTRDSIYII